MTPDIRALPEDPGGSLFLLSMLLDDSNSISEDIPEIVYGVNETLKILRPAVPEDRILCTLTFMKAGDVARYVPIAEVPVLTVEGYPIEGGTPLYGTSNDLLASVAADVTACRARGIDARSYTLLVSDGYNRTRHRTTTAAQVAARIGPMLASKEHIVAALGIEGGYVDFWTVFREMGIPREWIKVVRARDNGDLVPGAVSQAFSITTAASVNYALADRGSFEWLAQSGWNGLAHTGWDPRVSGGESL